MSEEFKNGDTPAYPLPVAGCIDGGMYTVMEKSHWAGGLTKREYFAAMALQGLIASVKPVSENINLTAEYAIKFADELLNQLESAT